LLKEKANIEKFNFLDELDNKFGMQTEENNTSLFKEEQKVDRFVREDDIVFGEDTDIQKLQKELNSNNESHIRRQQTEISGMESSLPDLSYSSHPRDNRNKYGDKPTKKEIEKQIRESGITEPKNLEEQAISLVGKDIYEKLVKGYTEKQWGRKAAELPTFIIKRLPVRYTYDNNYFNDRYQGIPEKGYNVFFDKLLEGIDVKLDTDFFENREELMKKAEKIVFTGMIDQYFEYRYGVLEYRSLKFENEMHETDNYQGNAVVNYCEREIPYTRIIEHKHFEFGKQPKTVITKEYPKEWKEGDEPYYPVNDEKNNEIFRKYKKLAENEKNVIFGGRLADYKYYYCHIQTIYLYQYGYH